MTEMSGVVKYALETARELFEAAISHGHAPAHSVVSLRGGVPVVLAETGDPDLALYAIRLAAMGFAADDVIVTQDTWVTEVDPTTGEPKERVEAAVVLRGSRDGIFELVQQKYQRTENGVVWGEPQVADTLHTSGRFMDALRESFVGPLAARFMYDNQDLIPEAHRASYEELVEVATVLSAQKLLEAGINACVLTPDPTMIDRITKHLNPEEM